LYKEPSAPKACETGKIAITTTLVTLCLGNLMTEPGNMELRHEIISRKSICKT
jgi:hypothetical protein